LDRRTSGAGDGAEQAEVGQRQAEHQNNGENDQQASVAWVPRRIEHAPTTRRLGPRRQPHRRDGRTSQGTRNSVPHASPTPWHEAMLPA
jgi:hypothetical protein